jgi:tRNA(Ile)-lysidine synthase
LATSRAHSMDKVIASLHRHVRQALERSGLTDGKRLVVAVSGGPDSLALLYALHHLRGELGLELHGAHLDHGLRGEASRADARFVAETFRSLGVPFTVEDADVASFRRERGLSLEDAAREVRYAFLFRVAADQQADAIALGHTSDDQAETVLLHLIRGSGLAGLRGMEPATRRALAGHETILARPLLEVSRRETAAYCRAMGLEPRLDESNLSPELGRNRLRLELLPILKRYNPAVRDALARLSRSVAQDLAFIEAQVEAEWDRVARFSDKSLELDRNAFARLPPAIQSHMLRRAVLSVKGDLEDVEQNHIADMVRLMAGPAGKSLDLPGGIRFSVGYAEAMLTPTSRGDLCPLPPLEGEHPLNIPGETTLPGWRVSARLIPLPARGEGEASYTAILDYTSLGGRLWVRPRRPGDRFQPLGMAQPKRLQDFMVDSRIPRAWRDRVPLVVSPRGIVWVVGWRIAEWARVKDEEGLKLELRFIQR